MSLIAAALIALSFALAQAVTAPKPPALTDAQKLAFFKANSEFQTASAQAQQANQTAQQKQAALQAAIKVLTEACGKDFSPSMDANNDPACVAKAAKQ